MRVQTVSELGSSYVPEGPVRIGTECTLWVTVCVCVCVCVYTGVSNYNPDSNSRQLRDSLAAGVVAQQHSIAAFASLRFVATR